MKIKIKQNILMEHLNYAIKGISNKNLIPILNCIKFELTNEGLYLLSTDNDISIKTFIDKKDIEEIEELGNIVVSGRYIYDIVKKLPNDIINIEEVMDSKIYIYTKNSSFNLNCNSVGDFPDLELEESKYPITLDKKVLKNIINQTIFATSTQESRPVLTGINFKIENDVLNCTATDSYRLANKKIKIDANIEELINIIIPTRNLNEIIRLINEDEGKVEIHIFSNKVIFKFDSIIVMSKLINGTYPDKNTIKLQIKDNNILLSSNIPEIGNVEEKVEILESNNFDIKIAFSSKYMMDALKSLDCDFINLQFNGEVKPIIIKNPDSDDLIQLILPIRTY